MFDQVYDFVVCNLFSLYAWLLSPITGGEGWRSDCDDTDPESSGSNAENIATVDKSISTSAFYL